MDEAEFDKFADEYRDLHAANIKLSGESPEYFAEYKVADIAAELERDGSVARTALDFGAGVGYSVPFFARHLPTRASRASTSRARASSSARRGTGRGRVSAFRRAADSVRRRHFRRRARVVRVPPHPARRARGAARRDPPRAGARRPAVRVRAQSAESR